MVPGRGIVAGPSEAVALSAGVSRASQHKRTLVRPQFQQALEGGSGILKSYDVVNFGVGCGAAQETRLVDAVNRIERHRHSRTAKDRGLVHVVPESGDTIMNKFAIESAPPLPSLRPRKIRKDGEARPHNADKLTAIGILHKMIARMAGVIRRVSLIEGVRNVEVGDVDQAKMVFPQICNQAGKIRESLSIYRERPIPVLVVNVEVEHIGRNLVGAKMLRNLMHLRLRSVAVA